MTRFSLSSTLEYNQNVTKSGSALSLSNFQRNRIMKKEKEVKEQFKKKNDKATKELREFLDVHNEM